ncbi:MAG: PTS sugar transporter subunit IIA, partial [Alphaproteobacteria bacterium]
PVDLILMLLAPEDAGSACLKALSLASRVLRNNDIREQLRTAEDAGSIRKILAKKQQAFAA